MSKRVSPTARLRADIDELFSSDRELSSILEDVARTVSRICQRIRSDFDACKTRGLSEVRLDYL